MDVLGLDACAAEGAGGVCVEPRVDALDVERVAALGEETERLRRLEGGEADGAFEPVSGTGQRVETEEREAIHDGSGDTGLTAGGDGKGVGLLARAVLGVEEEEEGDGEDDGEDGDEDGDSGSEGVGGLRDDEGGRVIRRRSSSLRRRQGEVESHGELRASQWGYMGIYISTPRNYVHTDLITSLPPA